MATLTQVDDDEPGERQADVGMDGVPDVEELQGAERCAQKGEESEMHEPAGPGWP